LNPVLYVDPGKLKGIATQPLDMSYKKEQLISREYTNGAYRYYALYNTCIINAREHSDTR